ncbi:MAG: MFS transporter [Chloroflexi bacterium]|nr:MFS transporter [Chloroflexota bacterium]
MSDRRWNIALYASAVFFFWMSQYIYVPTLPTYVQSKTTNLSAVGFVLSMYGLWQVLGRMPLSIAADWIGWRKPFLIFTLILGSVGASLMATSHSVEGLAVGRATTGAAASGWVLMVVGFGDLFPPQQAVQAAAVLSLINTIGRIIATSSTGWLNDVGGYSLAFWLAAGVGVIATIAALGVRETRRKSKPPTWHSVGTLIARRDVFLPSALSAVAQYPNWAFSFGFNVVLVKQLGGDVFAQSAIVTWHLIVFALGNYAASILVPRLGERNLVRVSFFTMFVGMLMIALASSLPTVFLGQGFLGWGLGVSFPLLMGMSIKKIAGDERATAMGVHQSIYAVGMFVGPALSGVVADGIGIPMTFAITSIAVLMLGLLGARFLEAG